MPISISAMQQHKTDFESILQRIFSSFTLMATDYAGKYHGLYRYATQDFDGWDYTEPQEFFDALMVFSQHLARELEGFQAYIASSRAMMDDTINIVIYVHEEDVERIHDQRANYLFAQAIGRGK